MAHSVSWEGQDTTAHDPMHCHVLQVRVEASCQASTPPWGSCSIILLFSHSNWIKNYKNAWNRGIEQ